MHDSLPSAGGSYFIFNRYMTVSLRVAVISFLTDTWQFGLGWWGCGGSYFIFDRYVTVSLGVAVISFLIDTGQFGLAPPAICFCTTARERLSAEMGILLRLSSAIVKL